MTPLLIYNICLIAGKGISKETLIRRFLNPLLKEDYKIKIGVDLPVKTVKQKIKFQFWIYSYDFIISKENWEEAVSKRIRNSSGIILMYDNQNAETLKWVANKYQTIKSNLKYIPPILLIGNKSDLEINQTSIEEVSDAFLNQIKEISEISSSMMISLETGRNIEKAFENLTGRILRNTELDYKVEVKKIIPLKGNKYITIPLIFLIFGITAFVSTLLYFFIYVFQ
jgi:GTPase SAR1 family protein